MVSPALTVFSFRYAYSNLAFHGSIAPTLRCAAMSPPYPPLKVAIRPEIVSRRPASQGWLPDRPQSSLLAPSSILSADKNGTKSFFTSFRMLSSSPRCSEWPSAPVVLRAEVPTLDPLDSLKRELSFTLADVDVPIKRIIEQVNLAKQYLDEATSSRSSLEKKKVALNKVLLILCQLEGELYSVGSKVREIVKPLLDMEEASFHDPGRRGKGFKVLNPRTGRASYRNLSTLQTMLEKSGIVGSMERIERIQRGLKQLAFGICRDLTSEGRLDPVLDLAMKTLVDGSGEKWNQRRGAELQAHLQRM